MAEYHDSPLYHDQWIDCTDDAVVIRGYYFPWGTKRIPYPALRGIRRVSVTAMRGQFRIWGTANPGYWASFDPRRPSKKFGFVLDVGKGTRPFVTPDDPDRFEAAVRGHTHLQPVSEDQTGPII